MNGFSLEGLARISPEQDAAMSGTRVVPGDVLLNITGASIGRVCVVPDEVCPANVNQHVSIIRLRETILPKYLAFFIASAPFQRLIMELQGGATRQALTKALIEGFRIPLPPLPEQKRIVASLTEQMAMVEKAQAATKAQLEAVAAFPKRQLARIFGGVASATWPRRKLHEMCELLPAKSISTDGDMEVCALTTACLTETGFDPAGVKVARMWRADAAQCRVGKNEILVARSNTPDLVGRVAVYRGVPSDVVASDLTIRIRPHDGLLPDFLAAHLSTLFLTGYWKEHAGGASGTMKKITRTQLLALKL